MRLVRVGAESVVAQFVLQMRVDGSGVGEADQAVGEVAFLGAGGQPNGQPPGGDVVDDGAAATSPGLSGAFTSEDSALSIGCSGSSVKAKYGRGAASTKC